MANKRERCGDCAHWTPNSQVIQKYKADPNLPLTGNITGTCTKTGKTRGMLFKCDVADPQNPTQTIFTPNYEN